MVCPRKMDSSKIKRFRESASKIYEHVQRRVSCGYPTLDSADFGNRPGAPREVLVELVPLRLGPLQRQPCQRAELVACVLQHGAQDCLQLTRSPREDQAKLGQEPADAVDAGGAVFLEPFAQPMHAQHALLLHRLDRDVAHLRPAGSLADRCRVVGVVLAARTLQRAWRGLTRATLSCARCSAVTKPRS